MSLNRRLPAILLCAVAAYLETPAFADGSDTRIDEIARGHSWVSPYWGYSTPKIVCDGETYYTTGLWGDTPDTSEGVVYRFEAGRWRDVLHLPGIYQPATLLVDGEGRVLVIHTRKEKPVRILRSAKRNEWDDLPLSAGMPNAYYVGAACSGRHVFLAYLDGLTNSMFLTTLDLVPSVWQEPHVIQEGQTHRKPKTAWTYPILAPTQKGLHLVASNSPDGGEGNTYNQVWYLFFPKDSLEPSIRELVADSPLGHVAYALDLFVDHGGNVHIAMFRHQRVYGEPVPEGAPAAGTYHARRNPETGVWTHGLLSPYALTGFHEDADGLMAVTAQHGTFIPYRWHREQSSWKEMPPLCEPGNVPAAPGFMDVISPYSGSRIRGLAIVTDGFTSDNKDERILWSLLPSVSN